MELDFETLNSVLEQTKKTKIFPFIIRNGYQNVSERGFESKGTSSYFFSFFQKVFTGSETITATWEDSTQLNVRDASQGTYNYDFQVGKYYEGVVIPSSEAHNTEIENVNGNDSFMAMQTNGDINVLFFRNLELESDHDFDFEEDYLYKLYIMPETNFGNKWLFISSISTSISPENPNLIIYTVTFSSLKDKLEQSGRALEQYVQYSAPGEPYAFPYITYDDEVIVSPLRNGEYTLNSVKYLQVELQGANAFSSVTVLGRRLYWDSENEKWYTSPSKFLVPYKFVVPQANPLNKTASPTKNFYIFPNETIETRATKEWLEYIKNQDSALAPMQNMGSFTMSGKWSSGVHESNNSGIHGHHYDYNDINWKPLSSYSGLQAINATGNVYCSDKIIYNKNDDLKQILIKNSMANIMQLELPLDMLQTRPYRWSNVPVIGFWTRWFGDRAINQNTINVRTNNLCYLIDTNLATMQYNAFTQPSSGSAYGNLQMFAGENAPAGLNPQSANTTLCFRLTDKVSFTDSLYYNQTELANGVDTVYWSQKTNESGTNLHTDGTTFLLNCEDNSISTKYVDYGFVIDNVIVNGLHIGKIKVSCFSDESFSKYGACDKPMFTQTILSNSMFEQNNIRAWTTNLTLGTWDSNWSNGEINWPLEPQKNLLPSFDVKVSGRKFYEGWEASQEKIIAWYNSESTPRGGLTQKNDTWTRVWYENVIYEQEMSYNELPGQFDDRASFINKTQNILVDVTGSIADLESDNFVGKGDFNGKNISINISDFSDYKVTKTQALSAFNNNDYSPMFKFETDKLLNKYRFSSSQHGLVKAGFNQLLTIYVELRESTIYFKITESENLYSPGWGGASGYSSGTFSLTGPNGNSIKQHILSYINKVQFILKQETYTITPTITNGTLSGSRSIDVGSFNYVWIVPNDNYTYPTSVTVTNATYTYDSEIGLLYLENPTGNVTITAECPAQTEE